MKCKIDKRFIKTQKVYLQIKKNQFDYVFTRENRPNVKSIFLDNYIQSDVKN